MYCLYVCVYNCLFVCDALFSLSLPQASVEAGGRKIVTITFNPPQSAIDSGVVEISTNVRNLLTLCVCVCTYVSVSVCVLFCCVCVCRSVVECCVCVCQMQPFLLIYTDYPERRRHSNIQASTQSHHSRLTLPLTTHTHTHTHTSTLCTSMQLALRSDFLYTVQPYHISKNEYII